MSKTYSKTRTLVECALMIALGTVLANIKIFEMPNGGSITLLSMLPFILVSYRHGTKWGLFTGFVNSLLQMLLGFYAPPAPGLLPLVGMILLDYVLAFTLLGLAVVFLFSGTQVIPTMKNNKRAVTAAWEQAQKDMAGVLPEHFPLPARYAHPVVLDRMIRVLREGRAQNAEEALAVVKADLKALNADVQVSQEEYDEVVAIKPMFLVSDYE